MKQPSAEKQGMRESLMAALEGEDASIGKPDQPTIPLVGSENVPISREEDKTVE